MVMAGNSAHIKTGFSYMILFKKKRAEEIRALMVVTSETFYIFR